MTTEQQLSEIRQRSYTAKRHADDLSPAWASYVSDTTFLLAELDAARAERDNAIDENIRLMNAETEALRAQLAAARAREQALKGAYRRNLYALAAWIRRPGNIHVDDAVDECARLLENNAQFGSLVELPEPETYVTGAEELTTLRAREAKLREKAQNYMSQFGQALEAHGIPYEAAQSEADSALRAALAEGDTK